VLLLAMPSSLSRENKKPLRHDKDERGDFRGTTLFPGCWRVARCPAL
jgi:hypothetical protein